MHFMECTPCTANTLQPHVLHSVVPPTVHFVHHRSMAMHMPSMQVGALGASHRHVVSPSVSGPPITLLHLVHLCPLGHYSACTVHGALTMYKCSVARPGPGWVALVGANPRSGGCGSTYINLAAPITSCTQRARGRFSCTSYTTVQQPSAYAGCTALCDPAGHRVRKVCVPCNGTARMHYARRCAPAAHRVR